MLLLFPTGMRLLSATGILLSPPVGMLGADGGGTQTLGVWVVPVSCPWGRAGYTATITAIPGPTGPAVPPKGPKPNSKVSREGQQKD